MSGFYMNATMGEMSEKDSDSGNIEAFCMASECHENTD